MSNASILLIKPGSMGDVIHALPAVDAIRVAQPGVRLSWMIDPRWAPLLEGNPGVSQQVLFPREFFRGPGGIVRAVGWYGGLGRLRPDMVLDLQGLLRSALMARFSGGRAVYGLDDARECAGKFYDRCAKTVQPEHAVRRYLRILPLVGVPVPETCRFPLPPGVDPQLEKPYIVIHPFARGAGKSLKSSHLLAFLDELRRKSDVSVVIAGVGQAPSALPAGVINLAGRTTLPELIGLLRGARFVVSVDSGPMHLAAALGCPLLGIHTWSDPRCVGPYGTEAWIWQGGEVRRQDPGVAPHPEVPFTDDSAREIARFVAARGA